MAARLVVAEGMGQGDENAGQTGDDTDREAELLKETRLRVALLEAQVEAVKALGALRSALADRAEVEAQLFDAEMEGRRLENKLVKARHMVKAETGEWVVDDRFARLLREEIRAKTVAGIRRARSDAQSVRKGPRLPWPRRKAVQVDQRDRKQHPEALRTPKS